jgi:phosphoenolpyruvate-protein kinase (PTS system EI component)
MHRSKATFIGNKRVENEIIYLNPYIKKIPDLNGKIICIEGADPGYDWIFSRKIAGLITKFGGANSHMAIRCSEYNLPAAIGCGEQPFEKIINSNIVILNCQEEKLESLTI